MTPLQASCSSVRPSHTDIESKLITAGSYSFHHDQVAQADQISYLGRRRTSREGFKRDWIGKKLEIFD